MEFNESIVISFLVVIIIILIFSKISVGSDENESEYLDQKLNQIEQRLAAQNTPQPRQIQQENPYDETLISDEFKKQLEEMENRFYYDNCRYNKN